MRYCFPPGLECQCGGLSGRREAQQAFALQTRAKRSWRTFVDNHYRVHCIYLLDSIGVSDYMDTSKMPHWHDMTTFTIPWGIAFHYISPKMTMIYKCLILLLTIELPTDCLLYRGMSEWGSGSGHNSMGEKCLCLPMFALEAYMIIYVNRNKWLLQNKGTNFPFISHDSLKSVALTDILPAVFPPKCQANLKPAFKVSQKKKKWISINSV